MTVLSTPKLDTLAEQVRAEIRAVLARRGHSQSALARALDVPPMWVSDRLRGATAITLADLERIAAALDLAPVDLMPRGGSKATAGESGKIPIDPLAARVVATVGEPRKRIPRRHVVTAVALPEQRAVRIRPIGSLVG